MHLLDVMNERGGPRRAAYLAHSHLGLDVAFVSEIARGKQIIRAVSGDAASFGIAIGQESDSSETYCERLLRAEIPELIPDAAAEAGVAELSLTRAARIGAYVGVPLRLADGTAYGTLAGMSHAPDPSLSGRDVRFLSLLGDLIGPDLDDQRRNEQLFDAFTQLIDSGRVTLASQPIVDIRSGSCLGVETLARFPRPFGRPDRAFAAAYEVGLGLEVERLVVRKGWDLLPYISHGQFLSMNLSPNALFKLADRANGRSGLPLESLCIEITEHDVVENYAAMRRRLSSLRERGLRIAIDDAGAGYASLRHIVELKPDYVKIDRSLIHGIADDHARRVAVSAFVLLALDLDATIIAEGVERADDLATVRDLGVHAAQGYLIAKPSPRRADMLNWLGSPFRSVGARDIGSFR